MKTVWRIMLALSMYHFCIARHFRGGTISWKIIENLNVEFKFKMAWSYGYGPGCTENKIGEFVNNSFIGGKVWKCHSGCNVSTTSNQTQIWRPDVGSTFYTCTAADRKENWEQGEGVFNYSFPNYGPFIISYTGAMWMSLSVNYSKNDAGWTLQTIVDVNIRSDTNQSNSSPITASKAFYRLQYECNHQIRIPMTDPDGDVVRCRWAENDECWSICKTLPGVILDEKSCTLSFDGSTTHYEEDGWYAVALTIEDFPRNTITSGNKTFNSTTPLSSVPLQFLIHTFNVSIKCNQRPDIVPPTPPQGSHISVNPYESINTTVYVSNKRNPKASIKSLSLTSPVGMTADGPYMDLTIKDMAFWVLRWTPEKYQKGDNIVCVMAEDSWGQQSDSHCFTYIVWDDVNPCDNAPCKNNGTCVRRGSSSEFDCVCQGFTGIHCQIEIDECSSYPCLHGGSCINEVNYYKCSCQEGYTGINCQTEIDECHSNPCSNDGSCIDEVNGYTCHCQSEYVGINCEIASVNHPKSSPTLGIGSIIGISAAGIVCCGVFSAILAYFLCCSSILGACAKRRKTKIFDQNNLPDPINKQAYASFGTTEKCV